ncbi:BnaA10g27510D [Brassica napus]|uniref:BnaA10g27510D protein n=1 Tax=Brassica napus TaxID=3708 RepID=A0A078HR49_BRANA|nr:BnaA10g27510D [Brassica napus]
MNPSTDQVSVAAEELAPPSQPHRLSTSCDVHPDERFSGFCPSCLCERLSVLDHNGAPPQPSRKPPTISTAALKALFKPSTGNNNASGNGRVRGGFFPELRRSKSFSAKNNEGLSGGLEPQRRSCDVRLRSCGGG